MSAQGLNWQNVQIPFSGGMNQKGDKRAQQPPVLDICKDVEFDDVGGLRTRKPYAALGVNILGGGTLSNVRRIVENGGELLCFTSDTLYSWDASGSVWVSKGAYLAPSIDEETKFSTNGDQVDCDRAELNGVIFYTWVDGLHVYIATADKTTGAVLCPPTVWASAGEIGVGNVRPRLLALTTKVLLFWEDGSRNLNVAALDPAAPSAASILAVSTAPVLASASGFNLYYDVVRVGASDAAFVAMRGNPTTSYFVANVTSALAVTVATKARVCDGVIACSVTPDGVSAQIARVHGGSSKVEGDLLTVASLADVYTAQNLGPTTATNAIQITAAHRSAKNSGQYRCYVYWDQGDGSTTRTNWVDDGNNLGTSAAWIGYVGLASRAFDYNGSVYVWASWTQPNQTAWAQAGASLQNTQFLFRDDNTLIAKASAALAAAVNSICHLPGVATTGTNAYSFCGSIRRIISVAPTSQQGYAQRAPRDITVTFDDSQARRCVRFGKTFYIAGAQILQYDGVQLVETGFPIMPWNFIAASVGSGGNLSAGTYAVKSTWRRENATGEIERSSTTNVGTFTAVATDTMTIIGIQSLTPTLKLAGLGSPTVEVWRTAVNPTEDAPFYLVTSKDPSVTSNPNRYLVNDPTAASTPTFTDTLADTVLTTKENNPENGSVLENLAPPSATVIAADQLRIYLAGIAGSPNVIWYSKQRAEGEIAAFNDALTIQLPATGGDITALAFLNETLIAFKGTAIYALPGEGFDNTGGGNNYGPPRLLSSDIGAVSADTVALTDMGLLFKSSKGWYLLDKGWQVQYVGGPVSDYDVETALAVDVVTSQHQVRIPTGNRAIVWDTLVNQWGEWTIAGAVSSCIWNGTHVYATSSGVFQQRSDFTGVNYGMDIETTWIKPAEPVGQCRVQWLMPLGEVRSTCALRVRIGRNYQQDGSGNWVYFDDNYRTPASTIGGPLQVRIGPSIPWMEAIKVRLTATNAANDPTPPTGEAIKLSAVGIEFGVQPGLFKRLAGAQKA